MNGRGWKVGVECRLLGYTGSPLPLDEWLRLRQTILSTPGMATSKRVILPPVILCCSLCQKSYSTPACDYLKSLRKGHVDHYCSAECSMQHHAVKNSHTCPVCGVQVERHHTHCPLHFVRKSTPRLPDYPPVMTACPTCNTEFLAKWRGSGKCSGGYATYCSKVCAEHGHSRRMSGEGNPKWKNGAHLARQQPHCAKAFRVMRPKILERDGLACVVCKRSGIRLEVHHIDNNPMNSAASNLVTLCSKCHRAWHAARDSKPSTMLWPWLKKYARQPVCMTSK